MATKPITTQAMLDVMKTQQQGCSEWQGNTSQLPTQETSSKQTSRRTEVMAAVLKYLVPAMTFYYPMFASRFGTDEQSVGMAMNEYAERLEHHGVNGIQFKAGIAALKAEAGKSDYFPNPERFALMCKQASGHSNGLPSLQDVLVEIIQRRGVERFNADWQFSHELIRLINQRKGGMIYEQTGMQFEQTIKTEYDHWVKRIEAGEQLPQPLQAISQKPAAPEHLKGITPQSALAKRVEAMRKDANERKASDQIKPEKRD